jgi:hypothetical protein
MNGGGSNGPYLRVLHRSPPARDHSQEMILSPLYKTDLPLHLPRHDFQSPRE